MNRRPSRRVQGHRRPGPHRGARALFVGGVVVLLVALLVAVVAPVSANGFPCGSALVGNNATYVFDPATPVTIGDDLSQPLDLEVVSDHIDDECREARRSRLMPAGIGVVVGGILMACGGALARRVAPPARGRSPDPLSEVASAGGRRGRR